MNLKIIQCKDSMMWYAGKVGETVVFVREDPDYYWSRDQGGHINIVHKKDAVLVYEDRYDKAIADVRSANLASVTYTTHDRDMVESIRQMIIKHLQSCKHNED